MGSKALNSPSYRIAVDSLLRLRGFIGQYVFLNLEAEDQIDILPAVFLSYSSLNMSIKLQGLLLLDRISNRRLLGKKTLFLKHTRCRDHGPSLTMGKHLFHVGS